MASSICSGRWSALLALVAVAAALTSSVAGVAAAAPASDALRSAARAKLVEGVDALRRGEHRAALDRFEEAYTLVPSPKIHYNFGLAYVGLGRRAEALSAFERFLAEAQDAPADKREKAARQAAVLRPQVGAVAIKLADAPDGVTIAVDGRDVGGAPLARPLYLDPGRHQIAARPPAGPAGPAESVEIRAGASVELVLRAGVKRDVAAVASPGSGPSLPPPATATLSASGGSGRPDAAVAASSVSPVPAVGRADSARIAGLSLGAAGVVLIGAGVTFGVLAKSESDSLSRDSASGVPPAMPTPFDPGKESRGTTYETLQVIGLAAGAVGLATGIVLYATTRGRATVEPGAGRVLAGANLRISF